MSQFSHYEQCPRCRDRGRDTRGDNLAVYHDGSTHCFSCGYHRFSVFNYWKNRELKENVPKSLRPSDYTREIPASAWGWLLQYGLPYTYWQSVCGYSPKDQRLVFSIGTPIAFSIGRYVGPTTDVPNKKWFVWGDAHKHAEIIGKDRTPFTVLVEDIVSAHKVGQVAETIPLFGTRIYNPHFYYLINENKPVVLWLDNDQSQVVKKQALQLESILNQPVRIITTDKDPKCYSEKEIEEILHI